ncbi:hypothetical protein BS17DRAFT_877581 [Gyrodon lividus]|nr:hypothetical protein BS17DRAFT_877581 [Gyrodon lividus]
MMRSSSRRSLPGSTATPSKKHHNRGYTLVWGPNGQPSLVGFGTGTGAQPEISPTIRASQSALVQSSGPKPTRAPTQPAQSSSKAQTSASSIPDLEATTTFLTGASSITATPTSSSIPATITSPFPSTYPVSLTATDTDSTRPSIPTGTDPTPTPTAVSAPRDHGFGAPFYLAIVLGTLCVIACVAAFVAWWIRSRARRRQHGELEDPWYDGEHAREPSIAGDRDIDDGSSFCGRVGANRQDINGEIQTSEYYLPASIVRRSTTNLSPLPHTGPTPTDGRALHNNISRSRLAQGPYPSFPASNNPYSQNLRSTQNPYYGMPSSQAAKPHSRPNPGRIATGLSVQESMRTLGRLRVANITPGDVTSGDEGGISRPGLEEDVRLTPTSATRGGLGARVTAKDRDNAARGAEINRRDRPISVDEGPTEPPGPATVPWGRRTSTVAALRRTRRSPGTTVDTYKNPRYSGYYHQMVNPGSDELSLRTLEHPEKTPSRPPPNPQGWANTFKSSFWNAVETVAGNRPPPRPGLEPQAEGTGSGSKFTPTPRRAVSRRSFDPQPRSDRFAADSSLSLTHTSSASSLVARDRVNTLHEILDGAFSSGGTHYSRDETWTPGSSQGLSTSTLQLERGYDQSQSTLQSGYEDNQRTPADSRRPGYGTMSTWAKESQAPLLGNEAPMGATKPLSLPPVGPNVNATNLDRQHSLPTSARHPYSLRTQMGSIYSTDSAVASANLREYGYGGTESDPPLAPSPMPSQLALPIPPTRLATQSSFQSDCLSTLSQLRSGSNSLGSEDSTLGSENRTLRSGNSVLNTETSTLRSGSTGSILPSESTSPQSTSTTSTKLARKKGVTTRRKRPQHIQRASSTASSMLSIDSGSVRLSIREEAARRALLARRRLAVAGGVQRARG